MGLVTMLKSEVRDILIGLYHTLDEQDGIDPEYRRGYVVALHSVALAIGVGWPRDDNQGPNKRQI